MGVMPIHDWTRVSASTWHSFHVSWIAELKRVLNTGLLPDGFYAENEMPESGYVPDVPAYLRASHDIMVDLDSDDLPGAVAAVAAPPRTQVSVAADETAFLATRRHPIAIRRESGDQLIALIELVSPGNKDRREAVAKFTRKVSDAVGSGVHVGVVDVFPPRRADGSGGLVGASADACDFPMMELPVGKPLCIGSIVANPRHLYADPFAVGDPLPSMPLFLSAGWYVTLDLENTYEAAMQASPAHLRERLAV
jgi:hypothetical protein